MSRSRTVSLAPEDSDILFNLDLCEAGVHQGDDDRSDEEYALDRAREAKDLYPRTFGFFRL